MSVKYVVKDGAYFCYCAYVLSTSRYSGFLWVVPTNTGIFFARFKTRQRKQELGKCSWYPKRKLGVTMHFSEILIFDLGKNAIQCFVF